MSFYKVTEQESNHKNLEKKSVSELVNAMHEEDNNALKAINKVLPNIINLIEKGIEVFPANDHMGQIGVNETT